ncbi:MAG: DinB family protein [Planctomycetes bacterium]|nr:DinB family protein [Planctomycetota bacterium]
MLREKCLYHFVLPTLKKVTSLGMTTADMLALLDDTWSHRWESVTGAIKDLREDEAAFQHAAYAKEEREEGLPPPGTVLWYLAHMAHCNAFYAAMIRRRPAKPAEPDAQGLLTLKVCLGALERTHADLRAAVAELPDSAVNDVLGNGQPIHEFVRACARHECWHSAQIAVARRLWRTR